MFGLGTAELIIILIIALIVLGPKEIPKVAQTIGKGLRELQRAKDDLKDNIEFDDVNISDASDVNSISKENKEINKS